MSNCGVCIGGGEYDGCYEFQSSSFPRARKQRWCVECRKAIQPGERYQKFVGKFDGTFFSEDTCAICAEIRDALSCGGNSSIFGEMWGEIRDYVFPTMTTGCFDRLETPEAKKELQRRWIEWKGLSARPSREA